MSGTYHHAQQPANKQQDDPNDGHTVDHGCSLAVEDAALQLIGVRVQKVGVDEEAETQLAKKGDGSEEPPDLKGNEGRKEGREGWEERGVAGREGKQGGREGVLQYQRETKFSGTRTRTEPQGKETHLKRPDDGPNAE